MDKLPEDLRRRLSAQATAVMSDFSNGFSELWSVEQLHELHIPTLMMIGMESPDIAQNVSVEIANAIPNARLAILPGIGHMAPVFQPEWVNPRIREHIAKTERAAMPLSWPSRPAA